MNRTYLAAVLVGLLLTGIFFPHFLPWVLGVWPTPAGTSPWYQFWSGFYIVALSAGTSSWLRKQNCHVRWCWRLGRFPVAEGQFMVCRHHHPDPAIRHDRVTADHIKEVYDEFANRGTN